MMLPGSAEDRSQAPSSSAKRWNRCSEPPSRANDGRRYALVLVIGPIIALVLLALTFTSAALTLELPENPPETRRVETIAPGVEHIEIRRGDFGRRIGTDRWTVNVLVLDPSKIKLSLGRALERGVGTETPSSIAARRGALAAVNGGYFRTEGVYRGEPAGILALAGKVLSEPARKRPGLALSNAGGKTRLAVVDALLVFLR